MYIFFLDGSSCSSSTTTSNMIPEEISSEAKEEQECVEVDMVIIQQTQEQCPVLTTHRENEDGFQSDTASNEEPVDRDMPVMDLAEGESDITATHFDVRDPGKWPAVIYDAERCFIVSQSLGKEKVEPDLSNTLRDGRHLTKDWFTKVLPSGLKVQRTWLAYSQSKNALFCVPCKLFTLSKQKLKTSTLAKQEG